MYKDLEELQIGDGLYYRATSAEKPSMRKEIVEEFAQYPGIYEVSYCGVGIKVERVG